METLIIQALSLAGVGVLVGVAWLMGFRQRARIQDEAQLFALAAETENAKPLHTLIDGAGRAAFVVLDNAEIMLVKAMGDRLSVRAAPQSALTRIHMYRPTRRFALGVKLEMKDLGFPDLVIELPQKEPPAWLDRLRREVG